MNTSTPLTARQEKVVTECLLFCFFNSKDETAVKARCLSALHALHLNPDRLVQDVSERLAQDVDYHGSF